MFKKSVKNKILVLTSSSQASDIVRGQLSLLNFPLDIIQAIIRDKNTSIKYKLSDLSAVILVLERKGLHNEKFQDLVKKCLSELQKRDDFRVFVFKHGIQDSEWEKTIKEFDYSKDSKQLLNKEEEFIDEIFDKVQVEKRTPKSLSEIPSVLGPYLEKISDIRDVALGTRLRLNTSILFGQVATVLQLLCAISTGIFFLIYFEATINLSLTLQSDILSIILPITISVVLFPLITIPLYLLLRGFDNIQFILQGNKGLGLMVLLFFILIPAWIAIFSEMLFSGKWLAIGAIIGIFLDIVRRRGLQTQRTLLGLDGKDATRPNQKIPPKIIDAASGRNLNPLVLPLFSDDAPDVFISYSTHQGKGSPQAEKLHQKLLALGTNCFRDVINIQEGTSFRRQLRRNIAKANTFICLADNTSIRAYKDTENRIGRIQNLGEEPETGLLRRFLTMFQRVFRGKTVKKAPELDSGANSGWVAAELETALAMRRITGLPEIIILTEPNIDRNNDDNFPIFNFVLNANRSVINNNQPRLIELKPQSLDVLVSGLQLYRFQVEGVFPSRLTNILDLLSTPLQYLGALGTLVGLIAWIFNFVWFMSKNITIPNQWNIVLILVGFWLGYVIRLVTTSRFQIKVDHASPFELTSVNVIAMLGLIVFEAILLPQVELILIFWTILLSGFGWLLADRFLYNVMLVSPELSREKIIHKTD